MFGAFFYGEPEFGDMFVIEVTPVPPVPPAPVVPTNGVGGGYDGPTLSREQFLHRQNSERARQQALIDADDQDVLDTVEAVMRSL